MAAPAPKRLRADAARNYARTLHAAKDLYSRRGLEVTLDDVAEAAGVGVGTVYRRFANKQELITAVFDRTVAEGVLRPGIAAFDLFAMVTMGEAMASFAKPLNSELWRRYLALMLDGFAPTTSPGSP